MPFKQIAEHVFAGRCTCGVRVLDEREGVGAAKLPCELTPEGLDGLFATFPRLSRGVRGAIEDGHARGRDVHHPCSFNQSRNARKVRERALPGGQQR